MITTLRLGTHGLYPTDIAAGSGRVWISNDNPAGNGGTVTELNAATGQWIATILDGSRTREQVGGGPGLIAVVGHYLWIENDGPWEENTWVRQPCSQPDNQAHLAGPPGGLPTAWLCEIRGTTTRPVKPRVARIQPSFLARQVSAQMSAVVLSLRSPHTGHVASAPHAE